MRCLSTGPGRFWLEEEPEVSWPARGFGPRWNSWDSPQVDQSTLLALLAHLLIVGHGIRVFHLDAAGVVSVLDETDRVRRLSPDRDGLYDLVSLDCAGAVEPQHRLAAQPFPVPALRPGGHPA